MRRIGRVFCALFVVASSQEAVHAASQTLFPRGPSPFSRLFTVPARPGAKLPQPVRGDVRPAAQAEIRTPRSRVVCGIKMIEGDPNVDSRMVIQFRKARPRRSGLLPRRPATV